MVSNYSKQFVAWVTGLQERYTHDLYFRTAVHITAVQMGFVLVAMCTLFIASRYTNEALLIFVLVVAVAIFFGVLLTRFSLGPARKTLTNQKLFISNVAHELRTPLSTIKTSSEVALLDDRLASGTKQTFSEIIEELNRISEIINNLLSLNTLTRPERMQFMNVDLGPMVEEVVRRYSNLARQRKIKMKVHKEVGAIVWGNRAALEQVMMNLVKNALSYTPENANGTVTVSLRPDGEGMILFSVADSGIGISQEDLFHIFEPFYRADTSRVRKIEKTGSGLGLTIVNEMVRAHHGKINIESKRRKGTTVTVHLPQGGQRSLIQTGLASASIDFSNTPQRVAH
jgi:two-component system phosphate regulon sensor histidine kinase PhoR